MFPPINASFVELIKLVLAVILLSRLFLRFGIVALFIVAIDATAPLAVPWAASAAACAVAALALAALAVLWAASAAALALFAAVNAAPAFSSAYFLAP